MSETTPHKETQNVVTIDARAGILQARAKMTSHGIRHLPVVDQNRRLIGIISDRDLRSAIPSRLLSGRPASETDRQEAGIPVADVMTANPVTISLSYTLQDILLLFQKKNVGAFPVVDDDGRVVGIISYRDMLRIFIQFLGVEQPGCFLCVELKTPDDTLQALVDAISTERIPITSVLVIQNEPPAVLVYLQTKDIGRARRAVEQKGYRLLNPLHLFLRQFQAAHLESRMETAPD